MPFFRAKAKFVSLMPHDLKGMKSQSMTVCYTPGEIFLDNAKTLPVWKEQRDSACTENTIKQLYLSQCRGAFFSPYYTLKSKQSLVHLLRRCKEKDIIHRMSSCCPLSVPCLLPCRCSYLVVNASSIIATLNCRFIYLYCISKTNNGLCNTAKYLLSDVFLSNK